MTLQLKVKDFFLANPSYDSSFLELLKKVVLLEGKGWACVNLKCVCELVWASLLAVSGCESHLRPHLLTFSFP